MEPYAVLKERLDRGERIVLDGPMGSELVRRGVRWRDNGFRTDSDAVLQLHGEYLAAGCDVVRTNTFGLNRRVYENVFRDRAHMQHIGAPDLEERVPRLIPHAAEVARAARAEAGREEVPIAGVMGPLEHPFRPDLSRGEGGYSEHAEIAGLLAKAGVDFLLLESMNTVAEATAALQAARATGLPVWVSFVVDGDGNVLSGESLPPLGADLLLVNCAPTTDIQAALQAHPHVQGGYAHLGHFDPPSWKFEFFPQFAGAQQPQPFADTVKAWSAQVVGACCGGTPEHVRALRAI